MRQLAEMAKVSNPYLSQIERGVYKPSAQVLKGIADALDMSAETLYREAGLLDDSVERPDADRRGRHPGGSAPHPGGQAGADPGLPGPDRRAASRRRRGRDRRAGVEATSRTRQARAKAQSRRSASCATSWPRAQPDARPTATQFARSAASRACRSLARLADALDRNGRPSSPITYFAGPRLTARHRRRRNELPRPRRGPRNPVVPPTALHALCAVAPGLGIDISARHSGASSTRPSGCRED